MEDRAFLSKIGKVNLILSIMIVILHSSCQNFLIIDYDYIFYNTIYNIIGIIADTATPLFFFISAYLFYRNFNLNEYPRKLFSRIKSLLIPFFIWSSLYFIIFGIVQFTLPNININQKTIKFDFIFIIYSIVFNEYNAPIWFIRTLFIFSLISPIFYYLLKKIGKYSCVFIIIFLLLNLLYHVNYTSIVFWTPIYFLGAYCSIHIKHYFDFEFIMKNKKIYIIITNILLLIVFILFFICLNINDKNSMIYYLFRFFSPIALILCILLFPSKSLKNRYNISFFIFCSHSIIILIIRKLLLIFFGYNNKLIFLSYIFTIFLTLIVIYITYKILYKISPKFLNILIGFRNKEVNDEKNRNFNAS